jgi:hypothetical protein
MENKRLDLAKTVTNRSRDPNFTQITGHIPNSLAKDFKVEVASEEITIAEAVEEAIHDWITKKRAARVKQ